MEQKYFHHRIKHNFPTDTIDKGIEVHDTLESALGAYHAYLGAYAYGRSGDTDYVSCEITDLYGAKLDGATWIRPDAETPAEA